MGTSAAAETLIYLGLDGHPISDATNYVSHVTYFAPVPEPATMLLLGTGLVGLAGFSRKKLKIPRSKLRGMRSLFRFKK